MAKIVSYKTIDQHVVDEWQRTVEPAAKKRKEPLEKFLPFFPEKITYTEMMTEMRAGTDLGLAYYRRLVNMMSWYQFDYKK
jgi:hypothetical protein